MDAEVTAAAVIEGMIKIFNVFLFDLLKIIKQGANTKTLSEALFLNSF